MQRSANIFVYWKDVSPLIQFLNEITQDREFNPVAKQQPKACGQIFCLVDLVN